MAYPEEKDVRRHAINSAATGRKEKTEYLDIWKISGQNEDNLPTINYPDLISYLLFTPNPFLKEELRTIKSAEA